MKKKYGVIFGFAVLLTAALGIFAGCNNPSGGGDPTGDPDPTVSSVIVSPDAVAVVVGSNHQFTAAVNGTNSPAQTVTWEVSGNDKTETSITPEDGILTIAGDETAVSLTITATSTADPTKSGTATVFIPIPPPMPTIPY